MSTPTDPFPSEWNQFRQVWQSWVQNNIKDLGPTRQRIEGVNFMADEVLATFKVGKHLVEFSTAYSSLLHARVIGVTSRRGHTRIVELAENEDQLNAILARLARHVVD